MLLLSSICCPQIGLGQATLECQGLFPAGAQIGATSRVTALGSFSEWPVNVWCSTSLMTVTSDDQANGHLKVSVSDEASPGVYWIRLFHKEKATALLPFRIGTLTELREEEVRQRKDTTLTSIESGIAIHGRLEKSNEVDIYDVRLAVGQTIVAALEAHHTFGSPMDAVLQLVDSRWQNVVAQNDDCHGLDPRIVHTAERDGHFQIRVFCFPATPNSTIRFAGGSDYVYRLTLTTGPYVERSFPAFVSHGKHDQVRLEGWNLPNDRSLVQVRPGRGGRWQHLHQNDWAGFARIKREASVCEVESSDSSPDHPQECRIPVSITGRLSAGDDEDRYCFSAKKGDRLRIRVDSSSLGFPLDPLLQVYDPLGKRVVRDDDSGFRQDASLQFTVTESGDYQAGVSDLHNRSGPRFVYVVRIEHVRPSFQLVVDQDVFNVDQGNVLTIPVQITRNDGFDDPIDISAVGLPSGLSVAPSTSGSSGDTSKKVNLKVKAEMEAESGPFRIIATPRGEYDDVEFATASTKVPHVESPQLWIATKAQP